MEYLLGRTNLDRLPFSDILQQELVIESSTSLSVDLRLKTPMKLPFGEVGERPSGWVKVNGRVAGEYVTGFGEGATLPEAVFTDDSGSNIAGNMSIVLEHLTAQEVSTGEALARIGNFQFEDRGLYPTARLAVEMAIIDMMAKANSTSVKELLRLPDGLKEVPYGFSIGADTAQELILQATKAVEQNAQKIKLKISPSTHEVVTRAIKDLRREFPHVGYMVDANGTYDPTSIADIEKLKEIDEMGLIMIEEPVSRVGSIRGIKAVRRMRDDIPEIATPICLDDCLKDLTDCVKSMQDGLAQIINIKPGRIGSFVRSILLTDWVKQQGGEVMVGGMLEATPGRCMTSLLGAYCLNKGFTIPGDLSLAQDRLADDLVPEDKQLELSSNGKLILPLGEGWGF